MPPRLKNLINASTADLMKTSSITRLWPCLALWSMSSDSNFFFQAEDGIRPRTVTGVQTCALPILGGVLAALLDALQERYARFVEGGLSALRPTWLERAWSIGRRVHAGDGREGLAVELAPDGALVIRLDDGAMVRVVAGEVTTEADRAPAH